MKDVPLFPLNTVLFPDGLLPLRIFEARYLDMISESLKLEKAFGVCLITNGNEAGAPADCHEIGTLAHIVDWDRDADGLLNVIVRGGQRFHILERRIRNNHLIESDIELIDDNDDEELPIEHQLLSDLLRQIANKFELSYLDENDKYLDAEWVGFRLAELLPLELDDKQSLLETSDAILRLDKIQEMLQVITPQ